MSSGQSLRNGSSVEPGLPNTFLMPKARSSSKVACLTVRDLVVVFVVFGKAFPRGRSSSWSSLREAQRRSNPDCIRGKILDCFAALAMTEYHHWSLAAV